jgi:hypothetical protein
MSKKEIIDQLQELVSHDPFELNKAKIEELQAAYKVAYELTLKEQQASFEPEPEGEAEFQYQDTPEDKEYRTLLQGYHEQKKAIEKAKTEELELNLKEKKDLISELDTLIKDEENIAKAYARFNAIKQKWNEIGPAPTASRRDLQAEYSRLIEQFYYNINIYRELQINDLKKNQELKFEIIEKIKLLKDEKSINQLDFLIHKYLDEWDEIGPTFKEEWEKIRNQFKESVNQVFERIREHRKSVRADHDENLTKKKEIIAKAIEVASVEISEMKMVQKATKQLIDLQKEWKHIGYSGRKQNDAIWKEFRAVCDEFFEKRAGFLKESNNKFSEIKDAKKALIEKAKSVYQDENVNEVANQLKLLQRQWKEAGRLLPQEEYRLFKEFRGYCDAFFNRKKEETKQHEQSLKDNLHKKEELLISFAKSLESDIKSKGEALIDDWKQSWNKIGSVPEKFSSKVSSAFNGLVLKAYGELGISKADIAEKEFKNKLDTLSAKEDPEFGLDDERRTLQKKIKESEVAVLMLEDKLAFFKYSDDTNPLKKDLLDRIEVAKEEVLKWRAKRKQIDLMIKDVKRRNAPIEEPIEDNEES